MVRAIPGSARWGGHGQCGQRKSRYRVCDGASGGRERILIAGGSALGVSSYVNPTRINTNGSLDSTFGTGGGVIAQVGAASDYIIALTLQLDGKIVVAGSSQNGNHKFLAQRYNSDGSLDNSSSPGGTTFRDIGTGANEFACALAPDPRVRMVIAGGAAVGSFGVARLGSNISPTISLTSTKTVLVSWPWPWAGWSLRQK